MEREVIKMVEDFSSSKIYIHLRKVDTNNVYNSNDDDRDKIKLFPITVGCCMHIVCSATYYHMMYNINTTNIQLPNRLEHDKLHVGNLFPYKKTQSFYTITQSWFDLSPDSGGNDTFLSHDTQSLTTTIEWFHNPQTKGLH